MGTDIRWMCVFVLYLVVVYRAWATLVWFCLRIYICSVFPSVHIHFLSLSPLPLVHSKYCIYTSLGKIVLCVFVNYTVCVRVWIAWMCHSFSNLSASQIYFSGLGMKCLAHEMVWDTNGLRWKCSHYPKILVWKYLSI